MVIYKNKNIGYMKRIIKFVIGIWLNFYELIHKFSNIKIMPFGTFISMYYDNIYHGINSSIKTTSINVVITHKISVGNKSIPLSCLVILSYKGSKSNNLNDMKISLDFNRNSLNTPYHTMSTNFDYSNFNILDFEAIEIVKIFTDIPNTINLTKQRITKEYNLLYP